MTGRLLPLRLSAEGLFGRYGFGDGNPFEFADRGPAFDDQDPEPVYVRLNDDLGRKDRDDLLELLVRRHLLPLIVERTGDEPEIVRIGTHHNTVREARSDPSRPDDGMPETWKDIEAMVEEEDVLDALDHMASTKSIAPKDTRDAMR